MAQRRRSWLRVVVIAGALGYIGLFFLDFDWAMVVRFQNLFYLVFIYDYIFIFRKFLEKKEKFHFVQDVVVITVLFIAARTLLSAIPFLPTFLDAIAVYMVCHY